MSKNFYKNFRGFIKTDKIIEKKHIAKYSSKNGHFNLIETNINKNIFVYRVDYLLNKTLNEIQYHNIDGISFHIGLKGRLKSQSLVFNQKYDFQESISKINLISNDKINHQMIKNQEYKALYLILKKDFLEKSLPNSPFKDESLESLGKEYFYKNIYDMKSDEKTKYLAKEIYFSPFYGELNELFIESKVLELIHHFYSLILSHKKTIDSKELKFSDYDIAALHKAKSILSENMQNPPSIIELSKLIKLNDFKLKVGFKKLFNITPFAYLYEERMQKARNLLENSELSVGEISSKIGYKQQQNFRKAFVKKFGILPKDMMKSRNYYY